MIQKIPQMYKKQIQLYTHETKRNLINNVQNATIITVGTGMGEGASP